MTTVNVRIEEIATGNRLYLDNGLWGPATAVLHAFGQACRDGRIPGTKWNIAEINEVTTGEVVRQALDPTTEADWKQSRGRNAQERVAAFRSSLHDEGEYKIFALEV